MTAAQVAEWLLLVSRLLPNMQEAYVNHKGGPDEERVAGELVTQAREAGERMRAAMPPSDIP